MFVVGQSRLKILDFELAKVCSAKAADSQSGDESLTLVSGMLYGFLHVSGAGARRRA